MWVVLNCGRFASQGNFGKVWRLYSCYKGSWGSWCYWHLVNSCQPRMLLNILRCRGQPPWQRIIQPNMLIMARLRNPGVGKRSIKGQMVKNFTLWIIRSLLQLLNSVTVQKSHRLNGNKWAWLCCKLDLQKQARSKICPGGLLFADP